MGLIALSPEKVKEVIKLNKDGKTPKDLKDFSYQKEAVVKTDEPSYENVVGQDSLNRFENSFKKNKKKKRPQEGHSQSGNNSSNKPVQGSGQRSNPRNNNNRPPNQQNQSKQPPKL
jgi:hypothetical protein